MNEFPISIAGRSKPSRGFMALNIILAIVIIFLMLYVMFVSRYSKVYVVGDSMLPTLCGAESKQVAGGDYVYADTFASPQRGDIIVINAQDDSGEWHTIIKRLIAEQGQSVELKEGVLYVNGEYVEESYVLPQNNFPDLPINNYGPVTVPEGCVFVLGDNRNVSSDSRGKYGMIDKDNIVGVVTVWSMTMKSFITGWNTFFEYTVPSIF